MNILPGMGLHLNSRNWERACSFSPLSFPFSLVVVGVCGGWRQQPYLFKGEFTLSALYFFSCPGELLIPISRSERLSPPLSFSWLFPLLLGFCSPSSALFPDLMELALFIVKRLWWRHRLSWFQSVGLVGAGEWLCKLSFAWPDALWPQIMRNLQR